MLPLPPFQLTWSVLPAPGRAAGGMCDFWHEKLGAHLIYLDAVPPLGGSPKVSVAFFPLRIFPALHSLPSPLQATPKNLLIIVIKSFMWQFRKLQGNPHLRTVAQVVSSGLNVKVFDPKAFGGIHPLQKLSIRSGGK